MYQIIVSLLSLTVSATMNCVVDSAQRVYTVHEGGLFYWEQGIANWQSAGIANTASAANPANPANPSIELANSQNSDILFMEAGESIPDFGYDLSIQGNYSVNPTLSNPNLNATKDYVYNVNSGGGIKSHRDIVLFGEFNITGGRDFQGLLVFNAATVTRVPLTNLTNARGFFCEGAFWLLMNGDQCTADAQYRLRGNLDLNQLCSGNRGRYLSSQLVNNTIYGIRDLKNQLYLDSYSIVDQTWSSHLITNQLAPGCIVETNQLPYYLTWSNPSRSPLLLQNTSPSLSPSKIIGLAVGLSIVACLLLMLVGILTYRYLKNKRHFVNKEHLCRPEDILPPGSLNKANPKFHPTLAIFDSPRQEFI